jgi:dienelactone hydrolase
VIVVHEWTGLNAYAINRAEALAREGYVAFALDMYGDGKEIPTSQARQMSQTVGGNFTLIPERFNAALAVLRAEPLVNPAKVAAIGYCFGGGIVLNMARIGTDLLGVVSFHGSLNTGLNAQAGTIKTPILAIQGEGDPAAPLANRQRFSAEMSQNAASFEYVVYPGVNAHNFTNPAGATYYPKEADMAWQKMLGFFKELFR